MGKPIGIRKDAIYARYSSHAQDGGTSIEVQLDTCRAAIARSPVHPPHPLTYIDRATTGRSLARPELRRLIDDAEAGNIGRVFVYKYDRLGRSGGTHLLIEDLEALGVEVISATEGENALARGVQLVVAQDYSRVLSERTSAGLIQRHREGRWTGGVPPYGYRVVAGGGKIKTLAVDPVEAAEVRGIFEAYVRESVSPREIARRLQARGVPTRLGAPWSFTTVRAVLTNPCVIGRPAYRRRKYRLDRATGRRLRRFRPESECVVRVDESLRIVPDELFERVRAAMAGRARRGGGIPGVGREETHALTGLLSCGLCGARCYGRKSENARGAYRYYVCGARVRGGKDACACPNVREDLLLGRLQRALGTLWESAGDRDGLLEELREAVSTRLEDDRAGLARIRADLKGIDARLKALGGLLIDPDVEAPAKRSLSRQMGELEAEREAALSALETHAVGSAEDARRIMEACVHALDRARVELASVLPGSVLNRIVGEVFGPMEIGADGAVVALRRKHPGRETSAVTLADSVRDSMRRLACSLIAA